MLTGRCSADHKRKEKEIQSSKTRSSNVGGKIQIKTARDFYFQILGYLE